MHRKHHSRAFTLIELLVVISILIVLASLLFPVVGAVTRNAKLTNCQSNERQILAALLMYSAYSDGRLMPPQIAWTGTDGAADFVHGSLWQYLGTSVQSRSQIMHCPADSLEQYCSYGADVIPGSISWNPVNPPYRNFSYSLSINSSTAPPGGPIGILLTQVKNPAGHVYLYEEFAPNDAFCYGPSDGDDWLTGRHGGPGTIEHRASYLNTNWRDNGRGNVGYYDGHVASMTVSAYFGSSYHFGPLNQ
jgi:prepilin-type N-terminal cleavage/methylation domain-containing protein/prepilin-type processing-associated H-X9-DG protein